MHVMKDVIKDVIRIYPRDTSAIGTDHCSGMGGQLDMVLAQTKFGPCVDHTWAALLKAAHTAQNWKWQWYERSHSSGLSSDKVRLTPLPHVGSTTRGRPHSFKHTDSSTRPHI